MKLYNVRLGVSEPWEFPWESLAAQVQERKGESLLLRLHEKICYKNTEIVQLIAGPRHCGKSLNCLENGEKLSVNITPIIGGVAHSMDEGLDFARKWRGWSLIGGIIIDENALHHRLQSSE